MERRPGRAGRVTRGRRGFGETLQRLLAADLFLREKTRARDRGRSGFDAKFFTLLLERRDLSTVRKEKGRLRSYLLASVKHFLADKWCHAMAVKRGKGYWPIPLEELRESEAIDAGRSDRLTADQIYERRWALTVLEQVLARLRDEHRSAGNLRFFDRMKKMLMDEPDRPSQAEIATEFEMTENAVKQAFYRFRQRYQILLREEISQTVAMPSDIEDELRHLIAVVRA